jgi:predicted transcriptional regulator
MIPEKLLTEVTTCQDVIKCAFNLNDFEILVYKKLSEHGPTSANKLAQILKKERSSVYRALQKLVACGICYRETKGIERGGYYHLYTAINRKELKKKLEECVENWYLKLKEALSKFD